DHTPGIFDPGIRRHHSEGSQGMGKQVVTAQPDSLLDGLYIDIGLRLFTERDCLGNVQNGSNTGYPAGQFVCPVGDMVQIPVPAKPRLELGLESPHGVICGWRELQPMVRGLAVLVYRAWQAPQREHVMAKLSINSIGNRFRRNPPVANDADWD